MNDTKLITQLAKLKNGSQLLYEPVAFSDEEDCRMQKLKVGDPYGLVDTAIKRIEQARELLTTISENGFMNDTNDTEAEVAEIVWQCREFLTPKLNER